MTRSVAIDEAALRDAMAAYQAGLAGAFDRVYETLAPMLRRYHLSLSRDGARADDLVQETFLQIHRSRHTYAASQPALPWVFAIARHVFQMDRRARMRRGRRELEAPEGMPEPAAPPAREPVAEAEALREALVQVPADRREALVLHHIEGLGFREIAARLGITEGAAKLRSSRGMTRLRALLTKGAPGGGDDRGRR